MKRRCRSTRRPPARSPGPWKKRASASWPCAPEASLRRARAVLDELEVSVAEEPDARSVLLVRPLVGFERSGLLGRQDLLELSRRSLEGVGDAEDLRPVHGDFGS